MNKIFNFILHPDRRNFIIYSVGAFFLKGVSFFLIPLYTNLLSPAEMGQYDLLRNFGTITEIILSLGLLQLIYVEFYDSIHASKTKLVASFISLYIAVSTPLYLLLAILLFYCHSFFIPAVKPIVIYLVLLTTYLNFFQVMLISVLKLSFRALTVSTLQVVLGVTTLLMNVVLVYGMKTGIDGIVVSTFIVTIFSCLFGCYYFRKQLKSYRLIFNRKEARQYLQFSLPFIPNVLSFWIMNSANRWILLHYSGLGEVGIYSVAVRLAAVLEPLLMEPFLSAYVPSVLKSFRDGKYQQHFLLRYIGIPVVFFGAGLLLAYLGSIVVGEEFTSSMQLIIPVSVAFAFSLVAQSSAIILQHKRKIILMMYCVLAGSIISVAVTFITVPHMGSMGAAMATLAGNFAWALLVSVFSYRMLQQVRKETVS